MSDRKQSLEQRLNNFPELKSRFESLLDAVEDKSGNFDRADDIEQYLIEQMREIAKEALGDWAFRKEEEKVGQFREKEEDAKNHSKKNFGGIQHLEKSA